MHLTPGVLCLPMNFPFGSGAGSSESTASIVARLPSKSVQRSLVALYMDTVERALCFLDKEEFEAELEEFWSNDEIVSDEWLAQFLLTFGLGSVALGSTAQSNGANMDAALASKLLDWAETCLRRAPFMLRTTHAVIRTLCLADVVK